MSSPLDLGAGFLAFPRGLLDWAPYRSLRAEGRQVVLVLLLRARFHPDEFWFAGQRIELQPGELIDSEEEIARVAGVSRKVVRTALDRLESGGLLVRRRVHPSGQCPHVISIKDYALLQFSGGAKGQREGQPEGQSGASVGPEAGPPKGPMLKKEEGEPRKFSSSPAARPADSPHAALVALLVRVYREQRGEDYAFHDGKDGAAVKWLLKASKGELDDVERRWRRALELGDRWPGCASIATLAGRWNELAPARIVSAAARAGAPRPVTRYWHEGMTPAQRAEFLAERTRIAPWLGDDAPAITVCDPQTGQSLAELEELVSRWRSRIEGAPPPHAAGSGA